MILGLGGALICLTVILLYSNEERELAEDIFHRMVKRAVEMEGTVTVSCFLLGEYLPLC